MQAAERQPTPIATPRHLPSSSRPVETAAPAKQDYQHDDDYDCCTVQGSLLLLPVRHYFFGLMTLFAFSATSSIALLVAALAWSNLPSRCRSLSPVTSPAACFSRPFMSSLLWSLNVMLPSVFGLCVLCLPECGSRLEPIVQSSRAPAPRVEGFLPMASEPTAA